MVRTAEKKVFIHFATSALIIFLRALRFSPEFQAIGAYLTYVTKEKFIVTLR